MADALLLQLFGRSPGLELVQELTRIILRVTFCECEDDDARLDSIEGRLVVTVADALPLQLFGRSPGLEITQN